MNTTAEKTRVTPEELAAMPDANNYELVDGELVERNTGIESAWIGTEIVARLSSFVREHSLGWAFNSDAAYCCFRDDPDHVRKPDCSFVARGRLPDERLPKSTISLAPDLAVEVISPNDLAIEVERKVREYLTAGVRLVWVVNPDTRTVRVHRLDGSVADLRDTDALTGEVVLPGFTCPIRDLFPPAPQAPRA